MRKIKLFIKIFVVIIILAGGYWLQKNKLQVIITKQPFSITLQQKVTVQNDLLTTANIKQIFNKVMPQLEITAITTTVFPGIYQVIANNEVLYVSKDGNYLFHGDILALTKPLSFGELPNYTEEVRKSIRLQALAKINQQDLIIFKPKVKSQAIVYVFTDVDCVYCQRFHQEIAKILDLGIEIRYIAFPRQGIDSAGYHKAVAIWCAADPLAMLTAAKRNEQIPQKTCNIPIAEQYNLGRKLNIYGTPTLLFADGSILSSYVTPENLKKLVAKYQKRTK